MDHGLCLTIQLQSLDGLTSICSIIFWLLGLSLELFGLALRPMTTHRQTSSIFRAKRHRIPTPEERRCQPSDNQIHKQPLTNGEANALRCSATTQVSKFPHLRPQRFNALSLGAMQNTTVGLSVCEGNIRARCEGGTNNVAPPQVISFPGREEGDFRGHGSGDVSRGL